MEYPQNPIAFLDSIVTRHKTWLRQRAVLGESVRYMREAVDQRGRGQDFMKHYVHNPAPKHPDPEDENCDLALLQLYEHWRNLHGLRPIEPWDGTRLRPWLPANSNPSVPALLAGKSLRHFEDAYTRWTGAWEPLDALGNAIESYFEDLRRHHIWSRPKGGGKLRLYRHNELNNIEVAPYSIRFWGFMKWADERRRTLAGETVEPYPHDEDSDITFMDGFNQDHFPWHDDVFGNGRCPSWDNQFGLRAQQKYAMGTYGFGLEFLEFHGDLLAVYNRWLERVGMPATETWRAGPDPWVPGVHHSAHILKQVGWGDWGFGGTNGKPLDPRVYAADLYDENLSAFDSGSEMGAYFEGGQGFTAFHGAGHIERCDIRDVYTNNYSLRFFHWHQWIDTAYQKLTDPRRLDRPKHFWNDTERRLSTPIPPGFFSRFKPRPQQRWPLTGKWLYRSYLNEANPSPNNPGSLWFPAILTLEQSEQDAVITLDGLLEGGYPEQDPRWVYDVNGHLDQRNVHARLTPDWWDERSIIVMTARGKTPQTNGHEYWYRGNLVPDWPTGKEQVQAIVGTVLRAVRPDDRTLEGTVYSFIAVRMDDLFAGGPAAGIRTTGLSIEDAVNKTCPMSGGAIVEDALLEHNGKVVGFCSKEHRDAFANFLALVSEKAPEPE